MVVTACVVEAENVGAFAYAIGMTQLFLFAPYDGRLAGGRVALGYVEVGGNVYERPALSDDQTPAHIFKKNIKKKMMARQAKPQLYERGIVVTQNDFIPSCLLVGTWFLSESQLLDYPPGALCGWRQHSADSLFRI